MTEIQPSNHSKYIQKEITINELVLRTIRQLGIYNISIINDKKFENQLILMGYVSDKEYVEELIRATNKYAPGEDNLYVIFERDAISIILLLIGVTV